MSSILRSKLETLKNINRHRSLKLPSGIDLSSNDYLGMSHHPALIQCAAEALQAGLPAGAAGSRLLRGHLQAHQNLEDFAANHFAAPRTLFFANGFQANYALLTTLPQREDIILYDALIHASMREAIAAQKAKSFKFPHNDLNTLEKLLRTHQDKKIWIGVETLYSMDGDFAPLDEIFTLAQNFGATLIADEAHSTGIFGAQGKGLCWRIIQDHGYENLITLHTCGKAIGVAGGLVCADETIIDYLINHARGFIYSTAPMPLQAVLVQKSLEILSGSQGDALRQKLMDLCAHAKNLFQGFGTQIIPLMIGDDCKAVRIAADLQNQGFDIRAIRPPTVPAGASRLRLSLSTELNATILQNFANALRITLEKNITT